MLATATASVVALYFGLHAQREARRKQRATAQLIEAVLRPELLEIHRKCLNLLTRSIDMNQRGAGEELTESVHDSYGEAAKSLVLLAADRYFEQLPMLGEKRAAEVANIVGRLPRLARFCEIVHAWPGRRVPGFGPFHVEQIAQDAAELCAAIEAYLGLHDFDSIALYRDLMNVEDVPPPQGQ